MDYNFNRQEQTNRNIRDSHAEGPAGLEAYKRKERRANGGCLGYPDAMKDVVSCEKARGTANRF